MTKSETVQFGKALREKYFSQFPKDVIPLNHGSYGATPSIVTNQLKKMVNQQEEYPDEYYLFTARDQYIEQIKALGEYTGIDYHNLALLPNVTSAVNAVLRSIPWDYSRDKILIHSTTYGACTNTVRFLHDYYGLQFDTVNLTYPMEDSDVVKAFEEKLSSGNYKLCMFDMITSMPGVKVPYESIIKLCHNYNAWSLIDGAHCAGLVDLAFIERADTKPDFLTSNLHKWFNVPKTCAFLYINPIHHDMIQTFPVSWSYRPFQVDQTAHGNEMVKDENIIIDKFWYIGTANVTPYFCIKDSIRFRKEICGGETNIRQYQANLQKDAIEVVLREFGPGAKLLENSTGTLNTVGMFNISFPVSSDSHLKIIKLLSGDSSRMAGFKKLSSKTMIKKYKAFAPVIFHNDELWVRFSCAIYNTIEDYTEGAKLVKRALLEDLEEYGRAM